MKIRRVIDRAEAELDRHTEPPHPGDRKHVEKDGEGDVETLREEQAEESAEPLTKAGPPIMTSGQWQGMVLGGLAGGAIGLLVLLPVALIPFIESVGLRILTVAVVGWFAGATAGAVYWGGRTPELEGEMVDVDGRPSIGTSPRNHHTDRRGRPTKD